MITKATLNKLKQIERHQEAVKRIVAEVEAMHGLEDVLDDENCCWAMDVDRQGSVCDAESAKVFLLRYLAIKEGRKS